MEFYVRRGHRLTGKDEIVLVGVAEDDLALPELLEPADKANGGILRRVVKDGDFRGKAGETALVPLAAGAPRRVLLFGLGPREKHDRESLRRALAAAVKTAAGARASAIAVAIPAVLPVPVDVEAWVRTATEAIALTAYRHDACKGTGSADARKDRVDLASVTFLDPMTHPRGTIQRGLALGRSLADGVLLARDLGNAPPNEMTPERLATEARRLGKELGLTVRVLGLKEMKAAKMGGLLAVGQGSANPPRLITMEWKPKKAKVAGTWCVVGKGVTFDTGGISIKPVAGMEEMKFDMCGAAAAFGIMLAVARLALPMRVLAIVPAAENMPSDRAYRPGDVVRISNGVTVEIISTDAEGRMILADALVHALKSKPRAIVDLATLTGACVVALGHHVAGLLSNHDELAGVVQRAGDVSGDGAWRLPITADYRKQIESQVADCKNSGGRWGGAITAGAFLEQFVGDTPWVHLDIAGTAWTTTPAHDEPWGATGAGVRIVTQALLDLVERGGLPGAKGASGGS